MTTRMFQPRARVKPPKNHTNIVPVAVTPVIVAIVNHKHPAIVDRVEWIRPMGPRAWETNQVRAVRMHGARVPAMAAQGPEVASPHTACEIAEKAIRTPSISHGGTSTASLVKMLTIRG